MDPSRRDTSAVDGTGATQNLLSSVFPLDWLFSAVEPEPPNSPKRVVSKSQAAVAAATVESGGADGLGGGRNESGSSGTDTETRTLLPQRQEVMEDEEESKKAEAQQSRGAIPKKRAQSVQEEQEENEDEAVLERDVAGRRRVRDWQRRAMMSRRTQDGSGAEEDEQEDLDTYQVSLDLRERIMEILSSPTSEECDRELIRLKQVLEERKKRRRNPDGSSPSHLLQTAAGRESGSSSQQISLRGSPRRTRKSAHWSNETPGTEGKKKKNVVCYLGFF